MVPGQPLAVGVEGCSGFRASGEGWASHLGGMASAQVGRQGRKVTTSARDGHMPSDTLVAPWKDTTLEAVSLKHSQLVSGFGLFPCRDWGVPAVRFRKH